MNMLLSLVINCHNPWRLEVKALANQGDLATEECAVRKLFGQRWKLFLGMAVWLAASVAAQPAEPLDSLQFVRLLGQQQWQAALVLGQRMIVEARADDEVFARLAEAANAAGQLAALHSFYQLQLQQPQPDARLYYGLGLVLKAQGDIAAAIVQQQECLRRLPEFSAPLIALTAFDKSWNDKIQEVLNELSARRPPSPNAHLGRGLYLRKQGEMESALNEFAQALRLNPAFTEACYQQVFTLNQLGKVADSLAAQRACYPADETGLPLKQRRDFLRLEINNLARSEQTEAALAKLETAWQFAQIVGDESYRGIYLAYQGTLYQQQGDFDRALRAHQQSLALTNKDAGTAAQIRTGQTLVQIGRDYFSLGDYDKAEEYYRQGLDYAERLNNRDNQALIAGFQGDLWVARGNLSEAISAYQRAAQLMPERLSPNEQNFYYLSLSWVYLRSGELQKAKEVIQQSLRVGRDTGISALLLTALDTLGELHLRSESFEEAAATYRELLTEAQARVNWSAEWAAYAGLARACERLGRMEDAHTNYQKAIRVLESMRARLNVTEQRVGFFQDKQEVYQRLVSVLRFMYAKDARPSHLIEAFRIAERRRSRTLLDAIGTAGQLAQTIAPELAAKRLELQTRFSQLETELLQAFVTQPKNAQRLSSLQAAHRQATEDFVQWQQVVRERHPRYAALRYPEPLTVEQVQQLLKQK